MTISCPLECPHLQAARRHEKLPDLKESDIPNRDIKVTSSFLDEHDALFAFLAGHLAQAALDTRGVVDHDVQEALEAQIRTYRTLHSGLIYETRAENALAAKLQDALSEAVTKYRQLLTQERGMDVLRDAEVLGILAFLQRLFIQTANDRPRGRAFIDMLRSRFGEGVAA